MASHGPRTSIERAAARRHSPSPRWPLRLPTGRAALGALLIVASVASVLLAHRAATNPPQDRVLVATRSIPAGHTLTADDLGSVAVDLPAGSSAVPLDDADAVIGRVTRHALDETDLLRHSDLHDSDRFERPGSVEVVLALEPAAALGGSLSVGQVVDVLSSAPEGEGTTTIIERALVTGLPAGDSGIGSTGRTPVQLSVADAATAEVLVDAAVRSTVTLVLPSPGGSEAPVEVDP